MRVRGMKPFLAIAVLALAATARAQDDQAAELAKKLANPIASLTSVPLQYNYDKYGGTNDGASVSRLNIQPVIPFSLNEDWNLISRTIVPLVDQRDFPVAAMNESGLGDTTASLFFSPKAPTAGGWSRPLKNCNAWPRNRSFPVTAPARRRCTSCATPLAAAAVPAWPA